MQSSCASGWRPDPEQVRVCEIAFDCLRAEERKQQVLAAAARGMLRWLAGQLCQLSGTSHHGL